MLSENVPELLTIPEVAAICRLHEMTVRRHIREGRLNAVRVGKSVRVRYDDLQAYLATDKPAAVAVRRVRVKPLTKDDSLFRLIGIVRSAEPSTLSEDKYAAFPAALYPEE